MTNNLDTPQVQSVLGRLFAAAAGDHEHESETVTPGWLASASARQRAEALEAIYMPVSAQGGRLLYALVRAIRPAIVVEFGTSFGISTIHLAAGLTDVGPGHLLTTELSSAKITAAAANLAEAGVNHVVTILDGDALDTLAGLPGPIDLVFLDGWKDLCLPVLRLLEPRLGSGALVVADDAQNHPNMADYLRYVRDPAHGYVTVLFPVEDGMELSCWTGARQASPEADPG